MHDTRDATPTGKFTAEKLCWPCQFLIYLYLRVYSRPRKPSIAFHKFQLCATSSNLYVMPRFIFHYFFLPFRKGQILFSYLSRPHRNLSRRWLIYDKFCERIEVPGRKSLSIFRICNFYERFVNVASITNEPVGGRKSRWQYSAGWESSLFLVIYLSVR